ncbi:MAG: acyltransferase family protein [Treponema sp.]|jgi:surface polysaccharide O-acyltransferase-like enzyme|nr:acyltransferase family protein [Treponema sp.]
MQNTNRVVYADLLRIAAALGIIMLHTAASRWYGTPVKSFNWQVMNVYDSLVRWGVPVFVMVSGMFQLGPKEAFSVQPLSCQEEYRRMFKKYIYRLLWVLVFWGTLYQTYRYVTRYFIRHEPVFFHEVRSIPLRILFGPPWYHLWFIYMIIGLYLLTPLIRIFVRHAQKSYLQSGLILFVVIGGGLPFLNFILGKIPHIPKYKLYLPLSEVSGYLGYYIAGYYFANYPVKKQTRIVLYILGAVSALITIGGTSFFSLIGERREEFFYEYLLATTIFTAWGVFLFFKETFSAMLIPQKYSKVIESISSCTLGIYLIHDLILQVFLLLGLSSTAFNPIFSIPLICVLTFGISWVIIRLFQKIPVLGAYVV